MEELARRILECYGYVGIELLAPGKGYRNHSFPARLSDGSIVNLMLYKREPGMLARIKRANNVSNFVYQQGLPARRTIDDRVTRLASARGLSYAALYDYLPGRTIPWEAYTMKHLKLLGKTLSDMHAMLADFEVDGVPQVVHEYEQIIARMQHYFSQMGVQQALKRKLGITISNNIFDDFEMLMRACDQMPERQVLHMDFVRSNILFQESTGDVSISGILDFEKVAVGTPLFDIARTLAFLLVDCKYKESEKVRKYFLVSGYQKRGAASFKNVTVKIGSKEINILERLAELFLVYDFYKFLRHNPYEYLPENEHFIRTRDLLLERQLM